MERARELSGWVAVLTAIPMVGQLVASRAVRDTVFLTEFDAVYLPRVMLAAAGVSLLAAVAVGLWMPRQGPRATAASLAVISGVLFVLEGALLDRAPRIIAVLLYLHVSVLGALVVSAFSSVVNERFDPLYAKTVVARAGTGGALGGVLGGVGAWALAQALALSTVLYGLGVVALIMATGMWSIGRSTQRDTAAEHGAQSGIGAVVEDRYLRNIAITILLLGATGVFVDYAMKAEADLRFPDEGALLSFFTLFYATTALVTFIVQAGLAKPLLARVGLGGTMAILPLSVALFAGLGALSTQIFTATLARGAQTVVSSSLFRSGYELLYTPIPPHKKRATKAVIDIACNRVGYGVGSVVIMALVAVLALDHATTWVLALAVLSALVSAWMVSRLHRGYVDALAGSLRDGSLVLQTEDVVDATTMYTLAQSAVAMNRHDLLESIEDHRQRQDVAADAARHSALVEQSNALLSSDPKRILGALVDSTLRPELASHVIDLLGDDLYARPAHKALENMGLRITGQLVDALLATDTPLVIRRRLPRLLRKLQTPRAVLGLVGALDDTEFEVRYRCGRALGDLRRAGTQVDIPQARLMAIVSRELDEDEIRWTPSLEDAEHDVEGEIDALLEEQNDRSLKHVFILLSLTLDRDAIVLSLRALSSTDENLRGTALEYLHNVLPDEVRTSLWPRLNEQSQRSRARAQHGTPDELLQSMQSLLRDSDRDGK